MFEPMLDQLQEAWRINNRVNLLLLDRISDARMKSTLSKRGGRDVARQFAHLHNVRLGWHEVAERELAQGLKQFPTKQSPTRAKLKAGLKASGEAIAELLRRAWERQGRVKSCKPGVIPMLGYLVAHEGHHRGSILLTLKQTGHTVDTETQYGIWDWPHL